MTYTDLYLKFDSETQANQILFTEHPALLNEDGEVIAEAYTTQNFQNIDIIGTIYNLDGIYDGEGNILQEATKKDGWHVNVRLTPTESADSLEPFKVIPTQPRRVWA